MEEGSRIEVKFTVLTSNSSEFCFLELPYQSILCYSICYHSIRNNALWGDGLEYRNHFCQEPFIRDDQIVSEQLYIPV